MRRHVRLQQNRLDVSAAAEHKQTDDGRTDGAQRRTGRHTTYIKQRHSADTSVISEQAASNTCDADYSDRCSRSVGVCQSVCHAALLFKHG